MEWETVIGLEVHAQLATKSKIFSGSSTAFGAEPNTQASALDLAMPGTLPVPNEQAFRYAIMFGLAIDAEIAKTSVFERKNYFYPDLPKAYQTTQLEKPIVGPGHVEIELADGTKKSIRIHHAHLEEDAGKSLHEGDFEHGMSGIDLNRAGTPLVEIVSEPDISNSEEAVAFAKKLHSIVTSLGICDGEMSQGSMRFDVNISVRRPGEELGSKEEANDYRYFPCPDLLPVVFDDDYIESIRKTLPELPDARRDRFMEQYGLSSYDASMLSGDANMAQYFETAAKTSGDIKLTANWIMGELSARLNTAELTIKHSPLSAEQLAGMIERIADGTISSKMAKQVFEGMWNGGGDADNIIEDQGLKQVSDSGAIEAMVDEVIANSDKQVDNFRNADESKRPKMLGYFVGQIMKSSKGQANPQQVNDILLKKLNDLL
mgnify:CR=1 FL=1